MAQILGALYTLANETGKQAIETTGIVAQSGLQVASYTSKV